MNVYDFDGTIYEKDSSVDFYLFCLKRTPLRVLLATLPFLVCLPAYKLHRIGKEQLKSAFFRFVRCFPDISSVVVSFWDQKEKGIQPWYLSVKSPEDVIISASPDFLLREIAARLGVRLLIASRVDPKTGRWLSPNCHGPEKVRRYREELGETPIDAFYSDSYSDRPMREIARQGYLIQNGQVISWQEEHKS